MKCMRKAVTTSTAIYGNNTTPITPQDVVTLLSQIPELKDYTISVQENPDGTIDFMLGDYIYRMIDEPPVPTV